MLQNLLIGREIHNRLPVLRQLFFDPGVRRAELAHRRKVEDVIDFLELAHYRDERIANLPYGVRKKIELGRALCVEPELLLLDEPASGLNPEETEDMGFWIDDIKNDLGISVLMIEHDMSLVNEVSDHVMALNNGRVIAEGSAQEVQNHPDVVAAYLGGAAGVIMFCKSVISRLFTGLLWPFAVSVLMLKRVKLSPCSAPTGPVRRLC